MKLFNILLIAFSLVIFASCESDEQNDISRAQACIDSANETSVEDCLDYITGYSSAESYAIRCAARFIANGLTDAQMVDAIQAKNDEGTSGDPILGMIGLLSFKANTATEAKNAAITAMSECQKSQVKAYVLFASMAKMATNLLAATSGLGGAAEDALNKILAGDEPTQTDMENALIGLCGSITAPDCSSVSADTADAIGESATTAYDTYCSATDSEDDEFCQDLETAINNNGSDTTALGKEILELISKK